jgi:hypothetical protein
MKHLLILKKLGLIVIAIFFHSSAFSQHRHRVRQQPPLPAIESGSSAYLLASNGFKQLKLGEDIKNLEMDKLGYMDGVDSLDKDSCYKLVYQDDEIRNMGNGLTLNLVGLRVYKNKIVNIYLFFPRDAGFNVLQKLEADYGKFTNAPGEFMYDWKTNGTSLLLRYTPVTDMGVAIFTCNQIAQQVAKDDIKRNTQLEQSRNLLGSL